MERKKRRYNKKKILEEALIHFTPELQRIKAVEEFAEVIALLSRSQIEAPFQQFSDELLSEIADAHIMLEQLVLFSEWGQGRKYWDIKEQKIAQLHHRVQKEKEEREAWRAGIPRRINIDNGSDYRYGGQDEE